MANLNNNQVHTAAVALEAWNYIRYIGPFVDPQTEPLFLCVRQGDLIVAPDREPSKLWYVNRLRAEEDDINRHACSFKHEGMQTYLNYNLPALQREGEAVLGPQVRFDLLRVDPMRKPCHIKVHQNLCTPEENYKEGTGDTEPTDEPMETDAEPIEMDAGPIEKDAEEHEKKMMEESPAPPLEWYLGVSETLKVVIKPFLLSSEGTTGAANERPIWELTTRDEAINEDNPTAAVPVARDPRAANNSMRREYYMRPDRFDVYERIFLPSKSRPV